MSETNDAKRGKVIGAAWHLHEFLLTNVGPTKDWPIRIEWDDEAKAGELKQLLNELKDSLDDLKK